MTALLILGRRCGLDCMLLCGCCLMSNDAIMSVLFRQSVANDWSSELVFMFSSELMISFVAVSRYKCLNICVRATQRGTGNMSLEWHSCIPASVLRQHRTLS